MELMAHQEESPEVGLIGKIAFQQLQSLSHIKSWTSDNATHDPVLKKKAYRERDLLMERARADLSSGNFEEVIKLWLTYRDSSQETSWLNSNIESYLYLRDELGNQANFAHGFFVLLYLVGSIFIGVEWMHAWVENLGQESVQADKCD